MKRLTPNTPESFFFTEDDLPLIEMQHVFAQSTIWQKFGMDDAVITTDLVVREMPPHRNFLVFAGLEEMIHHIQNIRFTDDHIRYLLDVGLIKEELVPMLKKFVFRGDVYAMKEGTIFFPGEPVVRITAPIIDANMIINMQMNTLVSNTIFASKMARLRIVSDGSTIVTGNLRAHSYESGSKATRAGVMFRMPPTTIPFFKYKYGMDRSEKFTTQGQHLFIKSFPDELSAMRAFAETFPDRAAFMVDTYDFKKGMDNAVTVAKELRDKGCVLHYVFVDSQPLLENTHYARKRLDEEGLTDVKIVAGSNIEEYQIEKLKKGHAPIDIYAVVTEFVTVSDAPRLEVVCKMAEMKHKGITRPTAKLAPGKESYPGVKQVFRNYDADGKMTGDIIGLEDEQLGESLLQPVMKNGEVVEDLPDFEQLQEYVDTQLEKLPEELKDIHHEHYYPCDISPNLQKLFESVKKKYQ